MNWSNNRLLCSLAQQQSALIIILCTQVTLSKGEYLYRPGEENVFAYFLTSGLASVVVAMSDGNASEAAFIGREGVTGALQLLGPAKTPTTCIVQLDGTALRIPIAKLSKLFQDSNEIRYRVLEYVQQESYTLGQVSGCNALHDASQRLARWLLMAQDRTGDPSLRFTQEFVAQMLGIRRTTVTNIAGSLHKAGLIAYSRGNVTILNRPALESHSCECYTILSTLQRELYRRPWTN